MRGGRRRGSCEPRDPPGLAVRGHGAAGRGQARGRADIAGARVTHCPARLVMRDRSRPHCRVRGRYRCRARSWVGASHGHDAVDREDGAADALGGLADLGARVGGARRHRGRALGVGVGDRAGGPPGLRRASLDVPGTRGLRGRHGAVLRGRLRLECRLRAGVAGGVGRVGLDGLHGHRGRVLHAWIPRQLLAVAMWAGITGQASRRGARVIAGPGSRSRPVLCFESRGRAAWLTRSVTASAFLRPSVSGSMACFLHPAGLSQGGARLHRSLRSDLQCFSACCVVWAREVGGR